MSRPTKTDVEVLEELVPLRGRDVLEVGCGDGRIVRALTARGARVTGLEISEEQLERARAADNGTGARYVTGRAESLPVGDGDVDLVVLIRSLHHVAPDRQPAALAEAGRAVRRGGAVYVAEPLAEGSFFELVRMVEDEREVRAEAQRVIAACGTAGLRRERTVEYQLISEIAHLEVLRSRVVGVDPARGPEFDRRRDELGAAFERYGEPLSSGARRFVQPMRADLLRA
jgi:SAM-dependent methyltransferase